ncbi:hypothetical protein [Rhizobium sp. NPDC090279]|uniref:hypothetical protein n=1 Tax=Rhizobium sp. NPDC090279 TaxID=3364499 RepID=UPI00383BBAD6
MTLRDELVRVALAWQGAYGIAPSITSAISEYDAAVTLLGISESDYGASMGLAGAVRRGFDFTFNGERYQIKANRPSGKPGSFVTMVPKARNYEWDQLIWILYNREYEIQEAWRWTKDSYRNEFHELSRLSPNHMRRGLALR